jgi:hypothetical protein
LGLWGYPGGPYPRKIPLYWATLAPLR